MLYVSLSLCLLSTAAALIALYKAGFLSEVIRLYISPASVISANVQALFLSLIAVIVCNVSIMIAILLLLTGGGISAR